MGGANGTATPSEGGTGVSVADRDRRRAAADPQPRDRELEGAAAHRALAHAAGPGGDYSGLGAVARVAGRRAGPSLGGVGLAGVLRGGRGGIAELSGGVAGEKDPLAIRLAVALVSLRGEKASRGEPRWKEASCWQVPG